MTSSRKRSNSKSNEKICLTWDEYIFKIEMLSNKIKASNIKFDYIYGILRGGYIPCVIISHILKIEVLGSYDIDSVDYVMYQNKNVLLIDDIVDTGKTINKYLCFKELGLKISVATLYKHKKCKFVPDFYLEENDKWIHFPYEKD